MSNRNLAAVLLATLCATASAAPADGLRISGPFTYENLSLYLLHAPGKQAATNLLTLREAIEQKKAAVYETGNVQQLSIENRQSAPFCAGGRYRQRRQAGSRPDDRLTPAAPFR